MNLFWSSHYWPLAPCRPTRQVMHQAIQHSVKPSSIIASSFKTVYQCSLSAHTPSKTELLTSATMTVSSVDTIRYPLNLVYLTNQQQQLSTISSHKIKQKLKPVPKVFLVRSHAAVMTTTVCHRHNRWNGNRLFHSFRSALAVQPCHTRSRLSEFRTELLLSLNSNRKRSSLTNNSLRSINSSSNSRNKSWEISGFAKSTSD